MNLQKKDAINNARVNGENILAVPTGYDYEKFKAKGEKEDLILTVAYVNKGTIKRKGLETFVEAAKYLPNLKFVVVGPHYDNSIRKLKSIASGNVKFTGFVPDEELPNALCEAMLCECLLEQGIAVFQQQ